MFKIKKPAKNDQFWFVFVLERCFIIQPLVKDNPVVPRVVVLYKCDCSILNCMTILDEDNKKQSDLLEIILKFSDRARRRAKASKKKKIRLTIV